MFKNVNAFASFSVDDLDKAQDFYGKLLGLNLEINKEWGMLTLKLAGGSEIMIYQKDNHEAATYTALNFPVKDVEKTVDDLIGKGITFEQYPEFKTDEKGISREWDMEIAWFKDPAGNIISVLREK